jgi:hypothetical protein
MTSAQALIIALLLCAIGAVLISIGVYVVSAYSRFFRKDHRKVMAWDAFSTMLAGPWSAPVIVAGSTFILGALALFIGASIGVSILWVGVSRTL